MPDGEISRSDLFSSMLKTEWIESTGSTIKFSIERLINAHRDEILSAWSEPGIFKRWIVPAGQQLKGCVFERTGTIIWTLQATTDAGKTVEHTLECEEDHLDDRLQYVYYNSDLPRKYLQDPIMLSFSICERNPLNSVPCTACSIEIYCDATSLWKQVNMLDMHTFWIEAMERLAKLIERESFLHANKT